MESKMMSNPTAEMHFKDKIPYKRVLQVMLFALFPVVDYYRCAGNAWQMMLAAQFMGTLLLGVILLNYGIKKLVKWYQIFWIVGSAVAIGTMPLWFYEEAIKYHFLYETWLAFGNLAVFGMILTQITVDGLKDRRGGKKRELAIKDIVLFGLWFAYILGATIMKDNSFRPEFDLIFFSVFYLVPLEKENLKHIFEDLVNGVLIGFSVVQTVAFLFRPYVDGFLRYKGLYYNSNIFDLICLTMLIFVLVKLTQVRRRNAVKYVYFLWLLYYGIIFSLIVLSVGRLSIMLALVITLVYGVVIGITEKEGIRKLVLKTCSLGVALVIALPLTFMMVAYMPRILNHPIIYPGEEEFVGDMEDPDNYVTVDEILEELVGRFAKLIVTTEPQSEVVENNEPEEPAEMDPDWEHKTYYLASKDYSGVEIRLAIWRTYLDDLNWTGHTIDQRELWVSPYYRAVHPHNIFIMQLHTYGIVVGGLFIAWMVCYIYSAFRYFMANRKSLEAAFILLVLMVVLGFGMFDCCWMNGQTIWVLLMFMQKYLWDGTGKNENK